MRLALRVCGFVVLTALALFAGGFGWFADKVSHLTTPLNPAKADAIIVLTGGQSRLDAAMDLLA
ncbi:YdcF family protein, partial [Mesorhizobium sp. M2D.F.Ca.ET.223.01.1.1]